MIPFHTRLFGAVVALTLAAAAPALSQQLELKIMAPAAPGGGWDQTARSMQQALVAAKIARSVHESAREAARDIASQHIRGDARCGDMTTTDAHMCPLA